MFCRYLIKRERARPIAHNGQIGHIGQIGHNIASNLSILCAVALSKVHFT